MLGLHEDSAHTLKSSDAQPVARLPSIAPDSLAKLEDEQEVILKLGFLSRHRRGEHQCDIVWPRLLPRYVSGRGTTQHTHLIFRPGYLWAEVVDVHYISCASGEFFIFKLKLSNDEIMKRKKIEFNTSLAGRRYVASGQNSAFHTSTLPLSLARVDDLTGNGSVIDRTHPISPIHIHPSPFHLDCVFISPYIDTSRKCWMAGTAVNVKSAWRNEKQRGDEQDDKVGNRVYGNRIGAEDGVRYSARARMVLEFAGHRLPSDAGRPNPVHRIHAVIPHPCHHISSPSLSAIDTIRYIAPKNRPITQDGGSVEGRIGGWTRSYAEDRRESS
ncbi:hypothetical protein EDD85DRAFT_790258 [Armillaria nabsnona]|nr:hypothetical protein EDD85DRAFT_790258 [Armillaria nabsnona]